jgi:SAM-dependent methyltransferase
MKECPICRSRNDKRFMAKVCLIIDAEHDLLECADCGGLYFDPLPNIEQLNRFYSSSYYSFSRWHDEGKGAVYAKRLNRLKPEGNFLDVGCATGFFIHGIKQNSDWNVYGVEFSGEAIRFARDELGLAVKEGGLLDAGFADGFFDYIHINNVLEHVVDPVSILKECRRIIKPDGHFFLSVPNGHNDSRCMIEYYRIEKRPARSIKGHIFFFPRSTMLSLIEKSGFLIERKRTGSIKRGLRNLGILPRKKNWKSNYECKESQREAMEAGITIESAKKYPDFYYRYRYIRSSMNDIPGLHDFGLDYLLLLRPKCL